MKRSSSKALFYRSWFKFPRTDRKRAVGRCWGSPNLRGEGKMDDHSPKPLSISVGRARESSAPSLPRFEQRLSQGRESMRKENLLMRGHVHQGRVEACSITWARKHSSTSWKGRCSCAWASQLLNRRLLRVNVQSLWLRDFVENLRLVEVFSNLVSLDDQIVPLVSVWRLFIYLFIYLFKRD